MRAGGILPAIVGTLYLTLGTALFSVPLGVAAAVAIQTDSRCLLDTGPGSISEAGTDSAVAIVAPTTPTRAIGLGVPVGRRSVRSLPFSIAKGRAAPPRPSGAARRSVTS